MSGREIVRKRDCPKERFSEIIPDPIISHRLSMTSVAGEPKGKSRHRRNNIYYMPQYIDKLKHIAFRIYTMIVAQWSPRGGISRTSRPSIGSGGRRCCLCWN